jgi:adenosylcobinamide-GDP ribazoletransferase
MYGLLAALQILTRLPWPRPREASIQDAAGSVGWFPAVGAALGVALVAVDASARLALDQAVVDALLVAFLVIVTGAFHLDGLIDAVDGLTAGPDAAGRQAAAGTAGAVAACTILLADFAAISALPAGVRPVALFLAPLCGRTAILAAYRLYPYGRAEPTLSSHLKGSATTRSALVGCAFAAAACVAVAGPGGLGLLALSLGLMHVIATVALHRLPGLTGDVYGAICEVSQLAVWLAAPFVLHR